MSSIISLQSQSNYRSNPQFRVNLNNASVKLDEKTQAQAQQVFTQISEFFNQQPSVRRLNVYDLKGDQEALRSKVKDYFEVYPGSPGCTYFGPKVKNQIVLENGMTRTEYQDGTIEEMDVKRGQGTRIYPNKMIETGRFRSDTYELVEGKRIQDGQTAYIQMVQELLSAKIDGQTLAFGYLKENGDQKLCLFRKGDGYILHEDQSQENIAQTLLKFIVLNKMGFGKSSNYKSILDSMKDATPLIKSLVQPKEECKGALPIFSLKSDLLLVTLKKAMELGIPIDFKTPDPDSGKNLFETHRDCDEGELIQLMIKMDPSILTTAANDGKKTPLVCAFFEGDAGKVKAYLYALEKNDIPLSEQELWLKRSFENDLNFTDESFLSLPQKLQEQIYRTAHAFNQIDFVDRLNQLGMSLPKIPHFNQSLLWVDMNAVERRDAIQTYLLDMRLNYRVLTESEFSAWNEVNEYQVIPKKWAGKVEGNVWINKENDFARIIGRDIIAAAINTLGSQYVKVPQKFVVVSDQESSINFKLSGRRDGTIQIIDNNLTVYAEQVERVDRKIAREEMEELVAVIDKVGYSDLNECNFLVGNDGIYFIDTEANAFSGPDWTKLERLSSFLAKEDHAWFDDLIHRKIEEQNAQPKPTVDRALLRKEKEKTIKLAGFDSATPQEYNIPMSLVCP